MYATCETSVESAAGHFRDVWSASYVDIPVGIHFGGMAFSFPFFHPVVIHFYWTMSSFTFENDGVLFAVIYALVKVPDYSWATS